MTCPARSDDAGTGQATEVTIRVAVIDVDGQAPQ